MPLIEIFLVITLSGLLIYLKRKQVKILVNKITASKLFPKIFWGVVLGIGMLCIGWIVGMFDQYRILSRIIFLNTTISIRGAHFIGPMFGIFAGITVGASSRPFSIKKLLYCVSAGFIGGLAYTIYGFFLGEPNFIQTDVLFLWLMLFSLALIPIAIGIADKSLVKGVIGLVGGSIGIFLYLVIWSFMILAPGMWGMWEGYHGPLLIFGYIPTLIGGILINVGIEFGEFADLKEFEKLKDIFKDIKKVIKE